MKSGRNCAIVTILFLVGPALAVAGPASAGFGPDSGDSRSRRADVTPAQEGGNRAEAALVILVGRTFSGLQTGNGFVVGDGTWVVTCEHMVFEKSKSGKHRLEAFVGAYSPYLGEACDARLVAADEDLDLAVLEVPWRGHPSLSLADANAVLSARRARVIGLYATGRRLGDWNSGPPGAESFRVDAEEHSLAFVAVRQHDPRSVSLDGIGQLGHGWSGAPMVLPGTTVAIGCFARIDNRGPGWGVTREEARGPAVSQVPRLVGVHLDDARFHLARTPLPSPEDAHAACSLALQATSFLQPGRYASALEPARAFVQHRPNSAFGHKMLAYASEHVDQLDAAREEYQRSLELDPNGLNAQLLYAQFLGGHGEPNAAQRILEPLWKSGQTHDLVGIALVNALSQRKELARCLEILDEAIQSNPRNAYLWQQRAACHMEREGLPAAVEPMSRAVELLPERGPLRGTLAHLLERTGALDEAEKHFRKLLEVEPENPVVYYWLADFLRRHRPSLQEEAVQVAEKALRVPANSHLPREDIERLIKQIREAAGSPTPQ